MTGFCQCGCGTVTQPAKQSDAKRGYHVAGPTDARCEVRCVRCGFLLAPAHVWLHSETGAEMRSPLGLRPSEGDIVAMTGEGPYFGQFVAGPVAPTCVVAAMKGAA